LAQDHGGRRQPSPVDRSVSARVGAFALHARFDSRQLTASGRRAFLSRFEREVDPEGVLPVAERGRRAESARSAYFTSLALKSAKARSRKASNGQQARSQKRGLRESDHDPRSERPSQEFGLGETGGEANDAGL